MEIIIGGWSATVGCQETRHQITGDAERLMSSKPEKLLPHTLDLSNSCQKQQPNCAHPQ